MPKAKVYDDAAILEALVSSATVEKAAEHLGCSRKTIFNRLQNADFRACLAAYRAERLRTINHNMTAATNKAVLMLSDVIEDESAATSDRLKAAALILDHAPTYADRLSHAEGVTYSAGQKLGLDEAWLTHDVWEGVDA